MPDAEPPELPALPELPPEAMSSWMLTPAPLTEGRVAKHNLVAATRELINAVTMLDISGLAPATVEEVRAEVDRVVDRLRRLPVLEGGPTDAGGDDARLLERSGITGASNPLSAPLHLWREGDRVRGWAEYPHQYEGPPGCVHGGFVAAAFDDLLGATQTLSGRAGFTGTLTIRLLRPTPLLRRIDYEGGVNGVEGRKIFAWGTASHAGELLAEASGVFVISKLEDQQMAKLRDAARGADGDA